MILSVAKFWNVFDPPRDFPPEKVNDSLWA
jgi:hypothetical protein